VGERLVGVGTLGLCRIGLVWYGGVFGFIDGFYKSVVGTRTRSGWVQVNSWLEFEGLLELGERSRVCLGGHVLCVLWVRVQDFNWAAGVGGLGRLSEGWVGRNRHGQASKAPRFVGRAKEWRDSEKRTWEAGGTGVGELGFRGTKK